MATGEFSKQKALKATEDIEIPEIATYVFSTETLHSIFLQPHSDGCVARCKLGKESSTARISMVHGITVVILSTLLALHLNSYFDSNQITI